MKSIGSIGSLKPGDVFKTRSLGRVYVYIGYYKSNLWSFYDAPDSGYLYIYCGEEDFINFETGKNKLDKFVLKNIRSRYDEPLEGNGTYKKRPKIFERQIGHVDLSSLYDKELKMVFGLIRVGDK